MDTPLTLTNPGLDWDAMRVDSARELLHLVIAWSRDEPHRIGEAAPIEDPCVLGRGAALPDDPAPRAVFFQQRPTGEVRCPPLRGSRISRQQLELTPSEDGLLDLKCVGRCPLSVNGEPTVIGVAGPGDTLTLQSALVLLVVRRRRSGGDPLRAYEAEPAFPFGAADPHGIVGESPAAWALRDALAFAAQTGAHVLVRGESGVGKELAARAIHAMAPGRTGRFVARNAATFPEGLVDSELFGTARGYPNAGCLERPGLIGEADGGTLFLDEIAELPQQLQAHLLRALDQGGEYQRLGEARARQSDFRLVAATNGPLASLKHDLAARLTLRIEVPGLDRRVEDIPLLLQHLLTTVAQSNAAVAARYFERRGGATAEPRIAPSVIEALLHHRYRHHLREIERLMWVALATSQHNYLALTPELRAELGLATAEDDRRAFEAGGDRTSDTGTEERRVAEITLDPSSIRRVDVEEALSRAQGSVTGAARLLGLKNRYSMYRLMKRLDIAAPEDDATEA